MPEKQNFLSGISRRSFLKSSALAAVGVMGSGALLAGCGNGRKNIAEEKPKAAAETAEPNFLKAPAPIEDSKIKQTIDTEVVVVGAGMAGLCAAIAAA